MLHILHLFSPAHKKSVAKFLQVLHDEFACLLNPGFVNLNWTEIQKLSQALMIICWYRWWLLLYG